MKYYTNQFTIFVVQNVGSKATLISDSCGIQAKSCVDDFLQVMVSFSSHAHGFSEGGCT